MQRFHNWWKLLVLFPFSGNAGQGQVWARTMRFLVWASINHHIYSLQSTTSRIVLLYVLGVVLDMQKTCLPRAKEIISICGTAMWTAGCSHTSMRWNGIGTTIMTITNTNSITAPLKQMSPVMVETDVLLYARPGLCLQLIYQEV